MMENADSTLERIRVNAKREDDEDDFDFEEYAKNNKLETLEDFNQMALSKHGEMKQMSVRVWLNIYNTGSHFSEDKYNQAITYAIFLIVFMALSGANYKRYVEDQARFEEEDSPLYFTFGSLNMMVMHFVCKCIHNFYYAQDGIGSMMCEMFAHLMQVFSRITIITILIAFAFGWQVIYENTQEVKKKVQFIYIFVLLMTAYDDYALSKWV